MSFVNNLKIISDGTPTGTKVITPDGYELACKSVRFCHNNEELPVVTIELIGVPVEAQVLHVTKVASR